VEKPKAVYVAAGRFYIVEESCVVRIYSLEDKALLKTFGKKGQGPGEFTKSPFIKPLGKELFLSSPGKISHYSFDGVLLNEQKVIVGDALGNIIEPAGDKYVAMKWGQSPGRTGVSLEQWVYLYDRDFTNKKSLYSVLLGREGQKSSYLFPLVGFHVDANNICVAERYLGVVDDIPR
jgi:hypothetical protein